MAGGRRQAPEAQHAHSGVRALPLWSVYPEWGWGTEDSAQALAYLKKFGSVTVLNDTFTKRCKRLKAT